MNPAELEERLMTSGKITPGKFRKRKWNRASGRSWGLPREWALIADLSEEICVNSSALAAYFASLRPRYQTAILSNSFAGARGKEQERYQFAEICDHLIYSHEEGMAKPERRIFELTCESMACSWRRCLPGGRRGQRCCALPFGIQASLQRNHRGHRRHRLA